MNLRKVRRLAFETGLSINYISKEHKITKILQKLNLLFEKNLILKGGTGLNRGYLHNKARFSEDIDLDFFGKLEKIKEIMTEFDIYKLDKPRFMNNILRYDCRYINENNQKDTVRIEFYFGKRNIVGKASKIILKSIIPDSEVVFNTYSFETLLAMKLIALHNRKEGKDIFDVFYSLAKNYDRKKLSLILNNLCKSEKIDYSDLFKNTIQKLEGLEKNYKYIQNSTNHYLTKQVNLDWRLLIINLKQKINELSSDLEKQ